MEGITIKKDSKIVQILSAQARNERVDTGDVKNLNDAVMALASEASPHNMWLVGQLVGFSVNELLRPATDWMTRLGDVKRIGYGEKVAFTTRIEGIRAFIQAKGATPAVSKIAHKQITLDTIAVSARPQVNLIELLTGRVQMSELVVDATREMQNAMLDYMQTVLLTGMATKSAPFYGSGSGVIATTFDPMILHWMRTGGVSILGDIESIAKLAALTGFTAATSTQQFAPSFIEEYNANGYIGTYKGANVVRMVNPYKVDGITTQLNKRYLYVLPTAADISTRPLKVLFEGDVQSQEQRNIDDKTYEVRLDQFFNAAIVTGITPLMSVYRDETA